ncbi:MAG: transposase [Thermanaeromonas sp.]|nr:transposase [Thermanaeromonas sp.]
MALLGYLYGETCERKLAEECRLNLASMWFLGYDLDEMPPDHSILSKLRARFGALNSVCRDERAARMRPCNSPGYA